MHHDARTAVLLWLGLVLLVGGISAFVTLLAGFTIVESILVGIVGCGVTWLLLIISTQSGK